MRLSLQLYADAMASRLYFDERDFAGPFLALLIERSEGLPNNFKYAVFWSVF